MWRPAGAQQFCNDCQSPHWPTAPQGSPLLYRDPAPHRTDPELDTRLIIDLFPAWDIEVNFRERKRPGWWGQRRCDARIRSNRLPLCPWPAYALSCCFGATRFVIPRTFAAPPQMGC